LEICGVDLLGFYFLEEIQRFPLFFSMVFVKFGNSRFDGPIRTEEEKCNVLIGQF
jgi:hypothetical protein